ncbi:hypothetical protein [Hymenobacter koreensis]|uniref:DUF4304 domain-containing protein n=1 Tax=Hymenobacter koreensis TaxID=1084523 RepID=A0ABP8JK28_9BACT
MDKQFTITKSTVECYKLRAEGGYWADVTIDANGNTGRIQIASDYGSWQNYWGACGCDFKTFLASISYDYAASKFGVKEWLDVDSTRRFYKELVVSYRRDETLTADKARDIFDEIEELDGTGRDEFERRLASTDHLESFLYKVCGVPEMLYEPDPRFKRFWKEAWPALLAEFKHERQPVEA